MTDHPITWFVIADGAHARILSHDDTGFAPVSAFTSTDAHHDSSDMGSERPGRTVESAGSAHHAIEPRSDRHDRSKRDFARLVADAVNEGGHGEAFSRLVLVAPSHTLQAIKAALDAPIRARLTADLAKDLVKLPDGDLHHRLLELVLTDH